MLDRKLQVQGPRFVRQRSFDCLPAIAMANSSQSEPDCWTTVGWAACSRACFEKAKQAVMYNGPRRLGLTHFSSSPMGAVWEFRKTAVRSLGGTLSSSVLPRKKALRSSSTAEKMEVALNDPNFVIFQLVTKDNIPALPGRKVLSYQPDGSYVFAAGQCPFLPDAAFTDYFKLKVRHLASTFSHQTWFTTLCSAICVFALFLGTLQGYSA